MYTKKRELINNLIHRNKLKLQYIHINNLHTQSLHVTRVEFCKVTFNVVEFYPLSSSHYINDKYITTICLVVRQLIYP